MNNDRIKKMIAEYVEVTTLIDKHCDIIEQNLNAMESGMCDFDGDELSKLSINTSYRGLCEQYTIIMPLAIAQNEISLNNDIIGYLLRMIHEAIRDEDFHNVVVLESELSNFVF